MPENLTIVPATPDRWPDLVALFEPQSEPSNCWCMWWRKTRSQSYRDGAAGNRADLQALVDAGPPPGLLAYVDGEIAGWCAVAPRSEYASLNRSRTLKPIDDEPVWSITCFVIAENHRRQGLSRALAAAAIDWAQSNGATIIEAYPLHDHAAAETGVEESYMGYEAIYRELGFEQASNRSKRRNIWRKTL